MVATTTAQRREAEQHSGRITTAQALNAAAHYLAVPVCDGMARAHRTANTIPCTGCLASALELVHRAYEHLRKRGISQ